MPDLTNSPLGGDSTGTLGTNYRRALANFSRFGTRKLAYYAIRIYGVTDAVMDNLDATEDLYDSEYPREYLETSGNILEAMQRGVQLMAEPYAYGDWDYNSLDPDYNLLMITAIVAGDTVLDEQGQNDFEGQVNQNSYTLKSAIEAALGNDFSYDYVEVERMVLRGDTLDTTGDFALGRNAPANKARRTEQMNAKVAAGKISLKRKP